MNKAERSEAAAALGRLGGLARAKNLSAKERSEQAAFAGKHGGWPKGRKRGKRKAKAA